MNILLTGADGFIGSNIDRALQVAGHKIRRVSRRYGIDCCEMLTSEQWQPHLAGMDAVINAMGIIRETGQQTFERLHYRAPAALFTACAQAGIGRVVQISALGANHAATTPFLRSKAAADAVLRRLDLDAIVLKPSLVYGAGGTSFAFFARLASLPLIPVVGDGMQRLSPVHVSDVVAVVMQALCADTGRMSLDVVGPQTITLLAWLQLIRQAQGLPPARTVRVPLPIVMALSTVAQHFFPLIQPDNLRMLQAGSTADVTPLTHFLGRKPLAADVFLLAAATQSGGSP